jgi:DNA-binding phage protein
MIPELSPAQRTAVAQWLNVRALSIMQRSIEETNAGRQQHAAILQAEASALTAAASDLRRTTVGEHSEGYMAGVSVEEMGGDYVASLKARMEKLGVLASDLARESGIAKSQLSRYFNSKTGMQPGLRTVHKLEAALQALTSPKWKAAPKHK